jgi:hypothetical protein
LYVTPGIDWIRNAVSFKFLVTGTAFWLRIGHFEKKLQTERRFVAVSIKVHFPREHHGTALN